MSAPLPGAGPAVAAPRENNALVRYLARFDDGEVLRWAFRGLLVGAIGVLAMDLRDLADANGWWTPEAAALPSVAQPILPPAVETDAPEPPSDPRPFLTAQPAALLQPMVFRLGAGGVLSAEGSIETGTAALFAAELQQRGEYVKSVSLNSPGGALADAMAMARLVRERGLSTQVADGALCASSCPLLLAGGVKRRVGDKAAVGLHQFYAVTGAEVAPAQAMSDAQATTARIARHLADMGVDPALWLHALDTPPRALYYLSPEELVGYRLVTKPAAGDITGQ